MDAIEEALAAAKAEHAKLTAKLGALQAAEAEALAQVQARHDTLAALGEARQLQADELVKRVAPLERGSEAALSRRHQRRKLKNVVLRLGLGTVALLGWLFAATSGWPAGITLTLFGLEVASVWWLADLADHVGMRDG